MTVVPMKGKSIGHTTDSWFLKKGSKPCAQKAKFSVTVVNTYLVRTYNMTPRSNLFEAFNTNRKLF
jgi:hypothetical protein